ncbi:MAG: class I SAM-dependent methyltransferase [Planctomycetota bacterium]
MIRKSVGLFGFAVFPGFCNVCRVPTAFLVKSTNLREDVFCLRCRCSNRDRQIFHVFEKEVASRFEDRRDLRVWNCESTRRVHKTLSRKFGKSYVSSEYFGPTHESGERIGGVLHEDMRHTSFDDSSLDVIVSGDVLEHVPDPRRAFEEARRILAPGGVMIFTAPYVEGMSRSDIRAVENEDGSVEFLKPPHYHPDPIRPDGGCLVYVVFGEDLKDVCADAGLEFGKIGVRRKLNGILGPGATVFTAGRPA